MMLFLFLVFSPFIINFCVLKWLEGLEDEPSESMLFFLLAVQTAAIIVAIITFVVGSLLFLSYGAK